MVTARLHSPTNVKRISVEVNMQWEPAANGLQEPLLLLVVLRYTTKNRRFDGA
jgi:hypothetical protein